MGVWLCLLCYCCFSGSHRVVGGCGRDSVCKIVCPVCRDTLSPAWILSCSAPQHREPQSPGPGMLEAQGPWKGGDQGWVVRRQLCDACLGTGAALMGCLRLRGPIKLAVQGLTAVTTPGEGRGQEQWLPQ